MNHISIHSVIFHMENFTHMERNYLRHLKLAVLITFNLGKDEFIYIGYYQHWKFYKFPNLL